MLDAIKHITDDFFLSRRQCSLVHMHCACSTVQLVWRSRLPFSWTMPPPNSPRLNALITRFRESYTSVSMSHESKRLKKSSSNWLNSGNALIQHLSEKIQCSYFSILPHSAEAQVIWGGTVKCLLIAYFIGNITAKKYQNVFTCVKDKVTANQRWDVFETQCTMWFYCVIFYYGRAALCNRAGHYIFALWFLSIYLLSFFFVPRLILAATDWMSTILWHMVWPLCEFKMQVWKVLQAARCKCRTQKSRQKSPSGHHPTTLSAYIFTTNACIDNRKKNL